MAATTATYYGAPWRGSIMSNACSISDKSETANGATRVPWTRVARGGAIGVLHRALRTRRGAAAAAAARMAARYRAWRGE
jgi:hypothetical protein